MTLFKYLTKHAKNSSIAFTFSIATRDYRTRSRMQLKTLHGPPRTASHGLKMHQQPGTLSSAVCEHASHFARCRIFTRSMSDSRLQARQAVLNQIRVSKSAHLDLLAGCSQGGWPCTAPREGACGADKQ